MISAERTASSEQTNSRDNLGSPKMVEMTFLKLPASTMF